MRLFFGKISKEFDQNQIAQGYYQAPRESTWMGNLQIGDYVYLIGGDKIQFWQAREWRNEQDVDRLYFDILNANLALSVNELIALSFLKLTKALFVLTSRSSPKAFHELELLEDLTAEQLASSELYRDPNRFRSIRLTSEDQIDPTSTDIQLFRSNGGLELFKAKFFAEEVANAFRDNRQFIGNGSRNKDKALRLFDANAPERIFSKSDINFRTFYDAFFCEYKAEQRYFLVGAFWKDNDPEDLTETFTEEERWENGYDDQFVADTNAIPEGSFIAIKSAYVRERTRSVMKIKARGKVITNYKDGHNLDVEWEKDFDQFEVDFGGYMTTVKEVISKDHIAKIWGRNSNASDLLTMDNAVVDLLLFKKQIILQGPPGTGKTKQAKEIAALLLDLDVASLATSERFKLIQFHPSYGYEDFVRGIVAESRGEQIEYRAVNKILGQFCETALHNWIAHKRPRTATSKEARVWDLFERFADEIRTGIETTGPKVLTPSVKLIEVESDAFRYKGGEGWSTLGNRMLYKDIVQAYLDGNTVRQDLKKNKNLSGLAIQHATYFVRVLNMFQEFMSGKDLNVDNDSNEPVPLSNYVLIIDEINRANLSAVLGELIYALEYRGEAVESLYEVDGSNKLVLPPNLYIIGTMNTADRSVGHIDYAIRRRFAFVDVLPQKLDGDFDSALFDKVSKLFVEDPDAVEMMPSVHLSSEFRPKDVWLGHSYFIRKGGADMQTRLKYEILPILEEYIKDGVLIESAALRNYLAQLQAEPS